MKGKNIIRVDPEFVSVVDESEDYTPQNTSLITVIDYLDGASSNKYIGAIKPNPY